MSSFTRFFRQICIPKNSEFTKNCFFPQVCPAHPAHQVFHRKWDYATSVWLRSLIAFVKPGSVFTDLLISGLSWKTDLIPWFFILEGRKTVNSFSLMVHSLWSQTHAKGKGAITMGGWARERGAGRLNKVCRGRQISRSSREYIENY